MQQQLIWHHLISDERRTASGKGRLPSGDRPQRRGKSTLAAARSINAWCTRKVISLRTGRRQCAYGLNSDLGFSPQDPENVAGWPKWRDHNERCQPDRGDGVHSPYRREDRGGARNQQRGTVHRSACQHTAGGANSSPAILPALSARESWRNLPVFPRPRSTACAGTGNR